MSILANCLLALAPAPPTALPLNVDAQDILVWSTRSRAQNWGNIHQETSPLLIRVRPQKTSREAQPSRDPTTEQTVTRGRAQQYRTRHARSTSIVEPTPAARLACRCGNAKRAREEKEGEQQDDGDAGRTCKFLVLWLQFCDLASIWKP
ncbi:hypothetical protein B0H13DRAFT_1891862 [Mycena leptocephala]|nr:hypothetical protein B0H13DRAFT_1891862 [Mycena leptocephala]